MCRIALLCEGSSLSWSYGSWIYNYIYNQCPVTLKLRFRILLMARCTRYNIVWYNLSMTCDRSVVFSGYSVSSTSKTDRHDITEILLKVTLSTINQTNKHTLYSSLMRQSRFKSFSKCYFNIELCVGLPLNPYLRIQSANISFDLCKWIHFVLYSYSYNDRMYCMRNIIWYT
jgi:hypothetical protein